MKKIQALLIVSAISILGIALSAFVESQQYPSWESTEATLQSVSIRNASSPTVAGASDWGSDIGSVKYIYRVGGKEYTGNRILPLQNIYLPREKVAALSKGEITISYNPSEPSQSFIYAATPTTQISMLTLAGLVVVLFGSFLPRLLNKFLGAVREST